MKKEALRIVDSLALATAWSISIVAGPTAASCDPNIGPIGGAFLMVMLSPLMLFVSPALDAGILALAAILLIVIPHLQERFSHPPAWWVTVAIASIPIVFGLSLAISYASGIVPEATKCAL